MKVGHSDPVFLPMWNIAQKIKGTLGITGLLRFRVPIDGAIWHLDVGSSQLGTESGPKSLAVRQLKCNVIWV
jgi:hypothetical protein